MKTIKRLYQLYKAVHTEVGTCMPAQKAVLRFGCAGKCLDTKAGSEVLRLEVTMLLI